MPVPDGIGARVAELRKARHLTQRQLADAARVSYSLLTKVESGDKPASRAFTAAVARALGVEVTRLEGRPYVDREHEDRIESLLDPIRAALDLYDLPPDPQVVPRELPVLIAEVDRLSADNRAARYTQTAARLPSLLVELSAHAWAGQEQAYSALAYAYRGAFDVASKLGRLDLAHLALARMEWAVQRGSDPYAAAIRHYLRSLNYLRAGDYTVGLRITETGRAILDGDDSLDAQTVRGQLHLGSATLAALAGDADRADHHLDEAERAAATTGEVPTKYWLSFGPTNVSMHRVAAAVELGRTARAIEVGSTLHVPAGYPATRVGHHYIDMARAYHWEARPEETLRSLNVARQVAPMQARYHPQVEETVRALVRAHRRTPETLIGYAHWLGVDR